MCDSISLEVWLDDMTDDQYAECRYPFRDRNDTDHSWIEFRSIFTVSPLTGAGFKITPIGMAIPGQRNRTTSFGRIAAYVVEANVPACLIGHNRLLVNGVPKAAEAVLWLLKWWLADNGCTNTGLNMIGLENTRITNVALTYLFPLASEEKAREALQEFRTHTESLLNKKRKNGCSKNVAYSYPPAPLDAGMKYTYTSYVKMREFKLSAYVKELNQPNAFLLPIKDENIETEVQTASERTLRIENCVHGKWLKDNSLDRISQWRGNPSAYEKVFGPIRETLRLDEGLRVHRLKKPTVDGLKLSARDKKLLTWHLSYMDAREHPIIRDIGPGHKQNQYFSAAKRRILDTVKIDISIPWDVQHRQFRLRLSELLVFPGEFKPAKHLEEFVFSRVSAPLAIDKLKAIVGDVIQFGTSSKPLPRKRSIFDVPLI